MRMQFPTATLSMCTLALPAACAAPPEPVPVDHGAGTVLRVDAALDAIVPPDYEIEKLHDGFQFTEGPVWVHENGGYLLFSDIPANVVYKWTPDGELTEFLTPVYEGDDVEGRSVGSNGRLDSLSKLESVFGDSSPRLVRLDGFEGHSSSIRNCCRACRCALDGARSNVRPPDAGRNARPEWFGRQDVV